MHLQHSIIRRSFLFFLLVFPGFIFNYLLYFIGAKLLGDGAFGIFYTSISIINVLFAPAVIIGLYFSRRFVAQRQASGPGGAVQEFQHFWGMLCKRGLWVALGLSLALTLLGSLLGIKSYLIILALVICTYFNYLAEFIRSALQAQQMFLALGLSSLMWLFLRFLFGWAGLVFTSEVWPSILAIGISTIPVIVFYYSRLNRLKKNKNYEIKIPPVDLKNVFYFMCSFALFSLFVYGDILCAYLFMDAERLAVYSASSVLPKNIIIVLFPLARVFFPIMIADRSGLQPAQRNHVSLLKSLAVTFALSAVGALVLIVFGGYIKASPLGIKLGDQTLVVLQSLTAIPLCLMRVLALYHLAKNQDKLPILLAIPLLFLLPLASSDPHEMALRYLWFSCIALAGYTATLVFKKESYLLIR